MFSTLLGIAIGKTKPRRMERCVRLCTSRLRTLRELQAAPAQIAALLRAALEGRNEALVGFEHVLTETIVSLDGLYDGYYAQAQDLRIWISGKDADRIRDYVRAGAYRVGILSHDDYLALRFADLAPFATAEWSLPVQLLGDIALLPLRPELGAADEGMGGRE